MEVLVDPGPRKAVESLDTFVERGGVDTDRLRQLFDRVGRVQIVGTFTRRDLPRQDRAALDALRVEEEPRGVVARRGPDAVAERLAGVVVVHRLVHEPS